MPKSSSLADGAKTYYRLIEAAIRWSGLLRFERRIVGDLGTAASTGGNGVSALAVAAVERRKNLLWAGSRRDAV